MSINVKFSLAMVYLKGMCVTIFFQLTYNNLAFSTTHGHYLLVHGGWIFPHVSHRLVIW
jgi:hypothetical protein